MGKKDEKESRVVTSPVTSPDTDVEVGMAVVEEKEQLKQGLHQRHIQMIVSYLQPYS